MSPYVPPDLQPLYPDPLSGEAVRTKLLQLLGVGDVPDKVPFETHLRVETSDGLLEVHISFANALGETVSAIVLVPKEAPRQSLAGIICLPGSMASAVTVAYSQFGQHGQQLVGWGRELARRGFATLSLSYKGCAARRGSYFEWLDEAKALAPVGRNQMGVAVEEVLMAARILSLSGRVDPKRIGVTGISLGGQVAWQAMACAPWLRAAAAVAGGLGSLEIFLRQADPARHSPSFFTAHLLRHFDHAEIVAACIAPRPLLVIAPTEDPDMPRAAVERLIARVTPVYQVTRAADNFQVLQPEGGHAYLPEYFEQVAEWLQEALEVGEPA